MVFVEKGQIDVIDGAFVVVDKTGIRDQLPIGGIACLMLEPGTRISHAAVTLASRVGTLLVWVGEAGVRLYSSGQPGGARSDRLLWQAKLALDDTARLFYLTCTGLQPELSLLLVLLICRQHLQECREVLFPIQEGLRSHTRVLLFPASVQICIGHKQVFAFEKCS